MHKGGYHGPDMSAEDGIAISVAAVIGNVMGGLTFSICTERCTASPSIV